MRIAYVIQNVGISLDQEVGDAVPVRHTLKGLKRSGHDITCLYLHGRNVVGVDDVSKLDDYYYCPQGVSGTKLFKLIESVIRRVQSFFHLPYFAFIDSFRFYEACVRRIEEYDICHEHQGDFSIGAALACARLNVPYILTVSAPPFLELNLFKRSYRGFHEWVATREIRYAYRLARKIICVSTSSKQQLIEDWQVDPDKIVVMPNGVDIELFSREYDSESVRTQYSLGRPDSIIGFVGNFQKWHGIDLLLQSFVQVLRRIPTAKLLLVGDGPARPEISKLISELNIESKVKITGYIPQNKVPEMLAAIDVTVLPYPRFPKELWFSPLKMYEYMAAGKAIVASKYGQIADVLLDGQNGMLVEPGNVNELTDALVRLLQDEELRSNLGNNAFGQAKNYHSWEQYIDRLENVYNSVLHPPV